MIIAGLKFDCARHQDVIPCTETAYCYGYEEKNGSLLYACFGVFDGHGGTDAVRYMKDNLMKEIVSHHHFFSMDNDLVSIAIKEGFVRAHMKMKHHETWANNEKRNYMCGTTAAIAVFRNDKVFIGHVGDCGAVLGSRSPIDSTWQAKQLTTAHTPGVRTEYERITRCGETKFWVSRIKSGGVALERSWTESSDDIDDGKYLAIDVVPTLRITRALGDFWSYNEKSREFIISPEPEVTILDLDSTNQYLILGTKGLWKSLCPNYIVNKVHLAEHSNIELGNAINSAADVYNLDKLEFNDLSKTLIRDVLQRWYIKTSSPADNVAVAVIVIPSWFLDKSRPSHKAYVLSESCNEKEMPLGEFGKLVTSGTTYSLSDVMDCGYLQITPNDYITPELESVCPPMSHPILSTLIAEDENHSISQNAELNNSLNDTNDWESQIEITSEASVTSASAAKKRKKSKKEPTYPCVFTRRRRMINFKRAKITFKLPKKLK